ncbi:MAG: hypothetical protein H6835_09610 [Planctomycetes bacterium]|nr:hypothetical protein [Planctomycetota bacterium]
MLASLRRPLPTSLLPLLPLLAAACGSGGSGSSEPVPAARVVIAVDGEVVPDDPGVVPPPLPYREQIGVDGFGARHRFTTPAGEPFAFDLISWTEGASGGTQVSVQHVGDAGARPTDGVASLARAGVVLSGAGLWQNGQWINVYGDGFARMTVRGRIETEQVLAVTNEAGGMTVVVIAIGDESSINQPEPQVPPHPDVLSRDTIYSSDAWNFGLPAIAVSGDRTTIVAYEGDRALGMRPERYELRLQHDATTGAVTGGGAVETSSDSGNWRDHEIAALYNVLAVARSEVDGVTLRLSFDRGATFGQEVVLTDPDVWEQSRLVQLAIAADYTLAVVFWQADPMTGSLQLRLVEGRVQAVDATNSPTWFTFDAPQVLYTVPANATPMVSGVAWSEGGDLAIGFGLSTFGPTPDGGWRSTAEFHGAVRPWGGAFTIREIDREEFVGYDPSVAALGQGSDLRVFCAYELRDGVRLAVSDDAGQSWTRLDAFGGAGAHNPSVFARELGGVTVVDVLYLVQAPAGVELHHARWDDFAQGTRQDFSLTTAVMETSPPMPSRPTPYGFCAPYDFGLRTTQVGWLGYDAVIDGDELVVVYDEVTQDAAFVYFAMWSPWNGTGVLAGGDIVLSPNFGAATPPPLAPGMAEPLPPVDPAHAHQLVLTRIQ